MFDNLAALSKAPDTLSVREMTNEIFRDLGYGAAFYISPISLVRAPDGRLANHGFPESWEKAYRGGYHAVDPIPDLALQARRPVAWNRVDRSKLSDGACEYLDRLRDWGMDKWVAIPAYGPSARIGVAFVSLPLTDQAGDKPDTDRLRIATQISFLRNCDLTSDQEARFPDLSRRELEVLHGIAHGRSKATIAKRMEISKDTVDTYVRRVYAKLGVSDRAEAVAQAVAHGILSAVDMKVSPDALKSQPTDRD